MLVIITHLCAWLIPEYVVTIHASGYDHISSLCVDDIMALACTVYTDQLDAWSIKRLKTGSKLHQTSAVSSANNQPAIVESLWTRHLSPLQQ